MIHESTFLVSVNFVDGFLHILRLSLAFAYHLFLPPHQQGPVQLYAKMASMS